MSMHDEVVIQCLCGKLKETVQLENTLPYRRVMCHCNTCRQVTGALTFTGLPIRDGNSEIFTSKLVKYATSNVCFRYFCATCGSHAMYFEPDDNLWSVCPGNIDEVKQGRQNTLEHIVAHSFLKDTVDQGLSVCLPSVPCYLEAAVGSPTDDIKATLIDTQVEYATSDKDGKLLAQCHCGSVRLYIDRPDSGGKWKGGICVCRSCRLAFGQTFAPFLSNIPFGKITWSDGIVFNDSAHSSITRFQSSAKAHRDFCTKCGASVFWSGQNEPGTVDIAAGILRAKEGALARSWITWDSKPCSFFEDAVDKHLVSLFESNLARLNDA